MTDYRMSDKEADQRITPFFEEAGTMALTNIPMTQAQRDLAERCESVGRWLQPRTGYIVPRSKSLQFICASLGIPKEKGKALIKAVERLEQPVLIEQIIQGKISVDTVLEWGSVEIPTFDKNDVMAKPKQDPPAHSDLFVTKSLYDQGNGRPFLTLAEVARLKTAIAKAETVQRLAELAGWLIEEKALLWQDAPEVWEAYNTRKDQLIFPNQPKLQEVCKRLRAFDGLDNRKARAYCFKLAKGLPEVQKKHIYKLMGKVGLFNGMPKIKFYREAIQDAKTVKELKQAGSWIAKAKGIYPKALNELREIYKVQLTKIQEGAKC